MPVVSASGDDAHARWRAANARIRTVIRMQEPILRQERARRVAAEREAAGHNANADAAEAELRVTLAAIGAPLAKSVPRPRRRPACRHIHSLTQQMKST